MFGGSLSYGDSIGSTNDTWELAAVDVPIINAHPASQYRSTGQTATFSVQAVQPDSMAYQWYHGDTMIPGGDSSTLVISNVDVEDAGEYLVRVSNGCGVTWSRPAMLTLDPRLQFYSSAGALELIWQPDPMVVLESADSPEGPWVIVPGPANPFPISGVERAKFFRNRRIE
jgi:hypothetical protein